MSQKGVSFIELLIACLLSSIAIICVYNLQIKTAELINKNNTENAAEIACINQHELLLAANK